MDRKQAIEIFKSRLEISDYEKQIPEYYQAMRMAVEALEAMIELEKRKFTLSDLENYIKFEDECVKKNFTFKSLIEAREKQTPKIPAYEGNGYDPEGNIVFDEWLCPCCNTRYEVDYDEYDFCPNCGQAIDRRECSEEE